MIGHAPRTEVQSRVVSSMMVYSSVLLIFD